MQSPCDAPRKKSETRAADQNFTLYTTNLDGTCLPILRGRGPIGVAPLLRNPGRGAFLSGGRG